MSEISDQIDVDALKPQTVSNDGVTIQRRSLPDLIAADKYKRAVAAADDATNRNPLRIMQIVPSGGPR